MKKTLAELLDDENTYLQRQELAHARPRAGNNDRQRQKISAALAEWGQCWLGRINLYAEDRGKPILTRYMGDRTVCNYEASFAVPTEDAELTRMIRERDEAPYTGTLNDAERVIAIFKRIDDIGGFALIWV